MEIEITYKGEDIKRLILETHEKQFGQAPDGEEWICEDKYGKMVVRNEKILEPEKVVEPEPFEIIQTVDEDPDFNLVEDVEDGNS